MARSKPSQASISVATLVRHNLPSGRSFRHHGREAFFIDSKVQAEPKLFHRSSKNLLEKTANTEDGGEV
jgi:hypothetical protein